MAINTNGIRIPVQDDPEPKRKKRPAPTRGKAPLKPLSAAKTGRANKAGKTGLAKFLLTMFVPAAIVGAGIYAWQQNTAKKIVTSVRQEARESESDFEERLRNLKNALTGAQDENQKLKEQSDEMNKRIALLEKAKIDFSDDELGLAFTYPAIFGEAVITKSEVASGTKFMGTFSGNASLVFGGISADFTVKAGEGPAVIAATDSRGFEENRGDYFILGPGKDKYEVQPAEILDTAAGKKALLIDKNSFAIDPEADGLPVDIGENAVVVINLTGEEYGGLAFVNSDFSVMPLESFKQMIRTVDN